MSLNLVNGIFKQKFIYHFSTTNFNVKRNNQMVTVIATEFEYLLSYTLYSRNVA